MRVYYVEIDESDDDITGVDFMGLVDVPAHLKNFVTFNESEGPKEEDIFKRKFEFDDDKQIVRGVFIAANMMIRRFHPEMGGEHYVIFPPSEIEKIIHKFHRLGFTNNVNVQHDPEQVVKDVYLFESFQVDRENGISPPKFLEGQRVDDGSWVGGYKIEDKATWEKVKSGEINGFSVEGWFGHREAEITKKEFSAEPSKELFRRLFLLARNVEKL